MIYSEFATARARGVLQQKVRLKKLHNLGIADINDEIERVTKIGAEISDKIEAIVKAENPLYPLSDQAIANALKGYDVLPEAVRIYRQELGILSADIREIGALNKILDRKKNLRQKYPMFSKSVLGARRHLLDIQLQHVTEEYLTVELMKYWIDREEPLNPYPDGVIVELLKIFSIKLSVEEVIEYRQQLDIPSYRERKNNKIKSEIKKLLDGEDPLKPYTDQKLSTMLAEKGIVLPAKDLNNYRLQLGALRSVERRSAVIRNRIAQLLDNEDPHNPYTDRKLSVLLANDGIYLEGDEVPAYRKQLVVLTSPARKHEEQGVTNHSLALADRLASFGQRLLVYLKSNSKQLQMNNGILFTRVADELGIHVAMLTKALSYLQRKNGIGHPAHRIELREIEHESGEKKRYLFLQPETFGLDVRIIAYLENNLGRLKTRAGIPIVEITSELGLTPIPLGVAIGNLKKKFPADHFIHQVVPEGATSGRRYYRLLDPEHPIPQLYERIIKHLEDNIEELQIEHGILVAKMAEELGIPSVILGQAIANMKKKFGNGHFIHRIVFKQVHRDDGKWVGYYRLSVPGQLSSHEQLIITYLEDHIEDLQIGGIVVAGMAAKLGMKSKSLGGTIRVMKTKLDSEHFIQQLKSKEGRCNGKTAKKYYLSSAAEQLDACETGALLP